MPAVSKKLKKALALLTENQQKDFLHINDILDRHGCLRDTTDGGLGKTHRQFVLAGYRDMKIGIVTNKDLIPKCERLAEQLEVEIAFIISWESLRGTGDQCNHDWLRKTSDGYRATKKLQRLLADEEKPVLVMFDEHQKAKNSLTKQHQAAACIARAVRESQHSVLSLVSATPIGEEKNMASIPKLCGITTFDEVGAYEAHTGQYKKLAFAELEAYCRDINEELTGSLVPANVNERNASNAFYNLITKVLIPEITTNMESCYATRNTIENRFYSVDSTDFRELSDLSSRVNRAYGVALSTKNKNAASTATAAYDGAAEKLKLKIIANEIRRLKKKNKKLKFLIFLWRLDSADMIKDLLPEYADKIGIVNGQVKDRETIRQKFREDNDDLDIIVGNPLVCASGGDWDDIYGDRPRVTFIVVNLRFLDIVQASMRAHRVTSKSNTHTILVFIKDISQETSILNKIAKSSIVLSDSRAGKKMNFPTERVDNDLHELVVDL